MRSSEGSCYVGGRLFHNFPFVESFIATAMRRRRCRGAGASLQGGEEKIALFEPGAIGVVFGGQLRLAVL